MPFLTPESKMPKGGERLRKSNPTAADKIDRDGYISSALKADFWAELDGYAASISEAEFDVAVMKACSSRQWAGPDPDPAIASYERLGTAQYRVSLVNDLAGQTSARATLPPMTPLEVRQALDRITGETNVVEALASFIKQFGDVRIRSLAYGTNTRLFAFRNRRNARAPIPKKGREKLFQRLAIPSGDAHEYLFLAFALVPPGKAKVPTCFDAGTHNLSQYEPGGMTKPPRALKGLPELVVTPPFCGDVSHPPRSIA